MESLDITPCELTCANLDDFRWPTFCTQTLLCHYSCLLGIYAIKSCVFFFCPMLVTGGQRWMVCFGWLVSDALFFAILCFDYGHVLVTIFWNICDSYGNWWCSSLTKPVQSLLTILIASVRHFTFQLDILPKLLATVFIFTAIPFLFLFCLRISTLNLVGRLFCDSFSHYQSYWLKDRSEGSQPTRVLTKQPHETPHWPFLFASCRDLKGYSQWLFPRAFMLNFERRSSKRVDVYANTL